MHVVEKQRFMVCVPHRMHVAARWLGGQGGIAAGRELAVGRRRRRRRLPRSSLTRKSSRDGRQGHTLETLELTTPQPLQRRQRSPMSYAQTNDCTD